MEGGAEIEASQLPQPSATASAAPGTEDQQQEPVEKGTMSPLTGSYLLILLAEPHSEEDRQTILQRLTQGKEGTGYLKRVASSSFFY